MPYQTEFTNKFQVLLSDNFCEENKSPALLQKQVSGLLALPFPESVQGAMPSPIRYLDMYIMMILLSIKIDEH